MEAKLPCDTLSYAMHVYLTEGDMLTNPYLQAGKPIGSTPLHAVFL